MAVYTTVERDELTTFLAAFAAGELEHFEGISDGIENTNYFVTTNRGRFVLTLFEKLSARDLPFYIELMAFLAARDVPSAMPSRDRRGRMLGSLCGRPALLVERLTGKSVSRPNETHCHGVGGLMGRLHVVAKSFPLQKTDDRGRTWRVRTAQRVAHHLSAEHKELLNDEMRYQAGLDFSAAPSGIIHSDLFRDNVLFESDQVSGVIDFYYACNFLLAYDLAVAVNDWCSKDDGNLDESRTTALLTGYFSQRQPHAAEAELWPGLMRYAALRFWLSRLKDECFPRAGSITRIKDPDEFRRVLLNRREQPELLAELWQSAADATALGNARASN